MTNEPRPANGVMSAGEYSAPRDVVTAALADGAVVLHMGTKRYYSLNETGSQIWGMLERGARRDEIVAALVRDYDVAAEQARTSLDTLIAALAAERLIERADRQAGPAGREGRAPAHRAGILPRPGEMGMTG